jgi:signal transduction histidine kinase
MTESREIRLDCCLMTTPPVDLNELRRLAKQVQAAEAALDKARRARDEAIRNVRRSTSHTVPEIADAAGVSQATVKTVIRGLR